MGIEVKEIAPQGCKIGEGPHWEAHKGSLLYVDIKKGEMHRLYMKSGRHQVLRVAPGQSGQTVSFAIPVQDQADLYVIGHGRSVALVDWPESDPDLTTREVKATLHTVESEGQRTTNRFNDGKCDPSGRLWAGTMGAESAPGVVPPELGALYRVDPDLTLTTCLEKISLSNGLAWDTARGTFYYIDSCAYRVDAFDYDDKTGAITNKRTFLDFKKAGLGTDIPDGMCLDSAGDLWVACFSGSKVIRINPDTQKITQTVEFPATNITSVCFGGENLDTLFVTSGSVGLSEESLRAQPAGATFAVTGLGVTGLPPTAFKVDQGALKGRI